jgi:hypothetical protein
MEPTKRRSRLKSCSVTETRKENTMDIPLLIAIIALLTWTLLPQLDRYADVELPNNGKPSRLQRLARWINE